MNRPVLPLDIRLMQAAERLLWLTGLSLLVVGVLRWGLAHPAWAVRGIVVGGDVAHQNAVTLRAQLALQQQNPLAASVLTVDLRQVQALFEAVPWVKQAVVQREFPARLRVTLVEHRAVAWWGQSGSGQLVNTEGDVFEANHDEGDELPEISGPRDSSAEVWALFQRLQPMFEPMGAGLQRLELTERGSWRARLDNAAWIELGRGEADEVLARTRRFLSTVTQVSPRYANTLASADLRYPNGYALRLRGVTTLDAGSAHPQRKTQ